MCINEQIASARVPAAPHRILTPMHAAATNDLVLGIDLGTSYFKVGLFNAVGKLCGLGREATPTAAAAVGYCEVQPEAFWQVLRQALRAALAQAGAGPERVVGVAYSSQANSFLLQDAQAKPLTPLILWPDARTQVVGEAVRALWQHPDFSARTGLGATGSPGGAVNKVLAWRNEKIERKTTHWRLLTISDYLVWGLTDLPVGDGGTASLLGMEDVPACAWWPEALSLLGLAPHQLVRLLRPGTRAGVTTAAARRLELRAGIPVTVGSLDHHMAALGAGLGMTEADVSESTGTVIACLRKTGHFSPRPGCFIGPDVEAGYFELAADTNGGAVLEAYLRRFQPNLTLDELSCEAGEIAPGSAGVRALPRALDYPGKEGFRGLLPGHGRGHEMRALLESVSASLCAIIERVCGGRAARGVIATGGGARSPIWLQLKADMLGIPFYVSECPEPACRGAALLAAIGAGWYATAGEAARAWRPVLRGFQPRPDIHSFYQAWRRWADPAASSDH